MTPPFRAWRTRALHGLLLLATALGIAACAGHAATAPTATERQQARQAELARVLPMPADDQVQALSFDWTDAVRERVRAATGTSPSGPIRMLTHLRYGGYVFNPVSFYYGFADDGETLDWVLAEITNTPWNQRHAYLLDVADAHDHGGALHWDFDKAFHVSPFMPMQRRYRWVIQPPGEALRVHMDVMQGEQREFDATLVLERRPLDGNTLASCLARYPLLTAKVGAAIYWQAARLWFKRTPFHPHPDTLPRSS